VFCDDARREQCVHHASVRRRGRPVTRRCFRSPPQCDVFAPGAYGAFARPLFFRS
jgi:hypothetical protein